MKSPEWKQSVFMITADPGIQSLIRPLFGTETDWNCTADPEVAAEYLTNNACHVLIIDAQSMEQKKHYSQTQEKITFLEICQVANQVNQGLTIIVLVNKLLGKEGDFARKCGATVIMDRKNISVDVLIYLIRILRKRSFRTVLARDLTLNHSYPVPFYHHLSVNNHYVAFHGKNDPYKYDVFQKLEANKIRHLYVKEQDFNGLLNALRAENKELPFSNELTSIRFQLCQIITEFFDISSDGVLHSGKKMMDEGMLLITRLEQLVHRFRNPVECLKELPYPRWSAIAHGMNCAIYTLILAKECGLEAESREIAFASLFHNIGLAEINQSLLKKSESEFDSGEWLAYRKHVHHSIELFKRKMVPISPFVQSLILHHHEAYDGSGFPDRLAHDELPLAVAFMSILASYDYFNTTRPGEHAKSPQEAWAALKEYHQSSSPTGQKFHPELLKKIEGFLDRDF